jgi:hypothetical protein
LKYITSSSAVIASGTAYSYAAGTATSSNTATQISTYLTYNTPGSSDLFIITAGTQDIIAAAPTNNTTAIATAATALTAAIQTLTNAGAETGESIFARSAPIVILTNLTARVMNSCATEWLDG